MNCCLCIRYSFINGVIKVQALLDFLSEVHRSKLCSREFPAETSFLRRRVEQFYQSEGRTTGPHHHGYSSNVQFGRQNEPPLPPATRLAAANPLFTVDASSISSPGQHFLSTVHVRGCVLGREK
ncbi:hypothetical protein CHARACLAT_032194 [Characodon lateralis]|uniref:Uncharacterized protein n=1 Tax=Characodon lateralis TaxID=208331 RepID=A0ABU7D2F2_9TELE|nr:hypothetical protein [Characodon lateralis]